jgi:hypothetical protein
MVIETGKLEYYGLEHTCSLLLNTSLFSRFADVTPMVCLLGGRIGVLQTENTV